MPEDTEGTPLLRLDQLLASLSHPTCRSILLTLAEDDHRDTDEPPSFTSGGGDGELFEAEVTYDHLPRLARAGLVEWDRDSATIARGPNFEEIRPLVTLINDHRDELPVDWFDRDG